MMQTNHARFAALLGTVLVGGFGLITLHAGTKQAFHAAYAMTVAVLLASSAAAWFCRRDTGIFWFGFSSTGWALLWLGFGHWLRVPTTGEETYNSLVNECLLTTRFLKDLDNALVAGEDLSRIQKYGYNLAIGHLLLTLVLAVGGATLGLILRRVAARSRTQRSTVVQRRPAGRKRVLVAIGAVTLVVLLTQTRSAPGPYFPTRADAGTQGLDRSPFRWYSKHLAAMHEPALWKPSQRDRQTEVYRLLWLPTFHHPVSVRVAKSGDTALLHVSVLDGLGGYDPGCVAVDRTSRLLSAEWDAIRHHLDAADFWSMPLEDPNDGGEDGDQLLVEGVNDGRYHMVDRHRPGDAYAALCKYFLELSGIRYQQQWDDYH